MRIIFRVDASRLMGSGHLHRCMSLAEQLRERRAEVCFISRAHPGHMLELLARNCFPVRVLPGSPGSAVVDNDRYAVWRGVSQEQDAEETLAAIDNWRPDWLVVDHYGLGVKWERALRPAAGRLMAIDDLPGRAHDVDLLLNQNFGATSADLPVGSSALLGPNFALLRPEYRQWRAARQPMVSDVRRAVVFFGGVDSENLTSRAIKALSCAEFGNLEVDVVVGAGNPHREEIETLARARPRTILHSGRPHLADLFAASDLALGAGGSATWERLCVGVPSILVDIAENQETACRSLAQCGLIEHVDADSARQASTWAEKVRYLVGAPERRFEMAREGSRLVDGLGVCRVAERLFPADRNTWSVHSVADADVSWAAAWVQQSNLPPDTAALKFVLRAGDMPLAAAQYAPHENGIHAVINTDPDWAGDREAAIERLLSRSWRIVREVAAPAPALFSTTTSNSIRLTIGILSDRRSWLNDWLGALMFGWLKDGHRIDWVHKAAELQRGDLCFLLGCGEVVSAEVRARFQRCLVVHESALPHGKGWSPLTWQVLEGAALIPVSLLEAADRVDSGAIYDQQELLLTGTELVDDLRALQAKATLDLCRRFVVKYSQNAVSARPQSGVESFYRRRTTEDSRLDAGKSLAEQFPLLRVVDNVRYPAFFEHRGRRYRLEIRAHD